MAQALSPTVWQLDESAMILELMAYQKRPGWAGYNLPDTPLLIPKPGVKILPTVYEEITLDFYNNHPPCTPQTHLNTLFAHFPYRATQQFSPKASRSFGSNRSVRKRWPFSERSTPVTILPTV